MWHRDNVSPRLMFAFLFGLGLMGCAPNGSMSVRASGRGASGVVHGGQQPISGNTVQLYSVGTTGDGSAATPLLANPAISDSNGNFTLTNGYVCPSASALVYVVGTGGSPSPGVSNPQVALMAALGRCGDLSSSSFITVNEITTVAAVYSLAAYMSSYSAVGSNTSDAAALAQAFTNAGYLANTSLGTTPGNPLPPGYTLSVTQVNTVADLLAACINSAGGAYGDRSVCGRFFGLTLGTPFTIPTDAIGGLLYLANSPSRNTVPLYYLIPPTAPFQPAQPQAPADFAIRAVVDSSFVVSPSGLTFSSAIVGFSQTSQAVTITNGTSGTISAAYSFAGPNAADFQVDPSFPNCSIYIPANSSCTIRLLFRPSGAGPRGAYFVVGNSSVNPSVAVGLAGSGSVGAAGSVTLSPAVLSFTQTNVTQPITLTNNGAGSLTINSFVMTNGFYYQNNSCGSTVAGGGSCTINVGWRSPPSGPGTLTVNDDDAAGPQVVGLSYVSPPTFPATVDFGSEPIQRSRGQVIAVHGPATSGQFLFTLSPGNSSDFSFDPNYSLLTGSCGYNYRSSSAPCQVTVYFAPSTAGAETGYLNVLGFGQIALTGTGTP
jgi:hypothetical protein